jgi:uncharacterized membrane protein YphA (DoxX/SURF4 family)
MANLGGLSIAYVASLTIWVFHRTWGNYTPNPEAFLISGAISLAVTGVSYLLFVREESVSLSPLLSASWPILLMIVYGVLIAMGVRTPVISVCAIWAIVVVIAAGCWGWSSLIWLHEQGVKLDRERAPVLTAYTGCKYEKA